MPDETQIHWAEEKEQVRSSFPIKLLIALVGYIPVWMVNFLVFPVSFFYYIFSARARHETRLYQKQLISYTHGEKIKFPHPLRQIISFSLCVLEKIEGWSGKFELNRIDFQNDSIDELRRQLSEGKGALLIGSHLGNIEMLRSLASFNRTGVDRPVPVTAIMAVKATEKFNKTLAEMNPGSALNIISPDSIGPDTICQLSECIEKGGLVVIAADRTSANARNRYISEIFLGKEAPFPYGTFLIAALLNVPTYFVFALRKRNVMLYPKYNMYVRKSDISFSCTRSERENRIKTMCAEFCRELESLCREYPFQWYNFYNFWLMPDVITGR